MIAACTIIAGNYRPAARVLAQFFLAHHPEASFAVLWSTTHMGASRRRLDTDRRIHWWRPSDLGLDAPQMHRLAGSRRRDRVVHVAQAALPSSACCMREDRPSSISIPTFS